jgi:hypothetical protein
MRLCAIGLAATIFCMLSLPGGVLRYAAWIAFPFFLVAFLVARKAARLDDEFKDTPWGV